jgi:hypothetical protein
MFPDDARLFLMDDGKLASWTPSFGGQTVHDLMLFDEPAEQLDSNQVISRQYVVTFQTSAWPGLKRAEVLVIDAASYRLRTDPMPEADGVFSTVSLTKV